MRFAVAVYSALAMLPDESDADRFEERVSAF
jgi:hypothetical protein